MLKLFIVLLLLMSGAGCGELSGENGGILLVVKNARGPAALVNEESAFSALTSDEALPSSLQVTSFRVIVSGPDFSPPIERFFPGDATEGTISGIPVGEDRTVLIEALNQDGRPVRRREVHHVEIQGGMETPVATSLVAVPWFTSLSDGSVVTTTRLTLEGYGEPGSGLEIVDHFGESSFSISALPDTDGSLTTSPFVTPSLSVGFFSLKPPLLPPGVHRFELRDPQTGESNIVTVTLVAPGRRPGTWVVSAGLLQSRQKTTLGMTEPFEREGYLLPAILQEVRR